MSKFMRDSICKAQQSFGRNFFFKDVKIVKSDDTRVLHSTPFILMCKNLVVLGESVFIPEKFLEKLQRLNGDFKNEG